MSREWKPGDVAMVRWGNYYPVRAMFRGAHWIDIDGAEFDGEEDDLTISPLVVIDPDDLDQVRQLCALLLSHGEPAIFTDVMADSLREFANPTPPKPDEPQGLGAVVEDAKGNRWVRAFSLRKAWADTLFAEDSRAWADIDAARVLSEGVTE